MFSVTLLFALLQLLGLAASATTTASVTKITTTRTSTTASATPTCPKTFYVYIPGGPKLGNFYFGVNSTGGYDGYPNQGQASTFAIQNNRLVTLTTPGGAASVPKGTGPKGGFIYSKSDTVNFEPVGVAFNQDCSSLVWTKKVSATVTLNAIYSNIGDDFYLGSTSDPPPNGADITSIISIQRIS